MMKVDILDLLNDLRAQGVMAVLENGQLQINKPTQVKLESTLIDRIQENKSAIIDFLESSEKTTQIPAIDRNRKHIPLSYAQERILQIDRLEGSTSHHISTICKITGSLNVSTLQKAYGKVIDRHEILRTIFRDHQGTPSQEILSEGDWSFDVLDFCRASEAEIMDFLKRETSRPFKLDRDPSIRAILVKANEDCYYFTSVFHHMAADGPSIPVFYNDLTQHYEALLTGKAAALPHMKLQYVDYACCQREKWDRNTVDNKLGFWYNMLSGYAPLAISADFPQKESKRASVINQMISKDVSDKVDQQIKDRDVTLYMYLLAAYKVLLYQHTGQRDLIVGSPIDNRQNEDIASLIGCLTNTVPLRSEIDPTNSFIDFLSDIRETVICAIQHQDVPVEKIIEGVEDQEITESTLIQSMFVLDQTSQANIKEVAGIKMEWETIATESFKTDLTFTVAQKTNGLVVNVSYRNELFKEETIIGLINHLESILNVVIENPEMTIADIPLMVVEESEEVMAL